MVTLVILYKYTEQGIKNIKDAPKRVQALMKAVAKAGIKVREILWRAICDYVAGMTDALLLRTYAWMMPIHESDLHRG
jgi:uncharacterized protein with GYD domain